MCNDARTLDRDSGCCQQTVVQQLLLAVVLAVRHGEHRQLFQQTGCRHQDAERNELEARVHNCNAERADAGLKREGYKCADKIEQRQDDDCRNDVEVQMHKGGAPCVLARADRGDHRADAGADVLTDDDRDCHAVADDTGEGECL